MVLSKQDVLQLPAEVKGDTARGNVTPAEGKLRHGQEATAETDGAETRRR